MPKKFIYRFFHLFGAALASFSMAALIFSFRSELPAKELTPFVTPTPLPKPKVVEVPKKGISVADEAYGYGVDSAFSLVIPSISASANIIPEVDPFSRDAYSRALKEGVAHARGTAYPGQGSTIFLFAHSTDSPLNIAKYNAVFYSLKDLEVGDLVFLYYDHQKYLYHIKDKQIVAANDVSWLYPDGTEKLILQTCYPPGTTLKRLLLIATPIT